MTELGLSAAEHARLNSHMLDIVGAARGTPVADGAGNYRFGGKGAFCLYANGQFHDFSGGAREHGHNALQLIEHLYPNEDATEWARAWLACHPGAGGFVPGEGDNRPMIFAEVEASTYIQRLYDGAAALDGTPGHIYLTQTRGLPFAPRTRPNCAGSPTIVATRARFSPLSPTTTASSSDCW